MRTPVSRAKPWRLATLLVAGVAASFLLIAADVPNTGGAVGVAQANLAKARAAVDSAEKFHSLARSERSAAVGGDATAAYAVEKAGAADRLRVADAKMRFADVLLTLRKQEVELRQAELDLASARANLAQFDRLYRNGVERDDYVRLEADAETAVRQKRAAVDATRATLDARRHDTEIH